MYAALYGTELHCCKCRETISQVEQCLHENPRMANLWTPDSHYTVRTSMYNPNARSESVSTTQQASLLVDDVDSSQREALIAEMATQQQVCHAQALVVPKATRPALTCQHGY